MAEPNQPVNPFLGDQSAAEPAAGLAPASSQAPAASDSSTTIPSADARQPQSEPNPKENRSSGSDRSPAGDESARLALDRTLANEQPSRRRLWLRLGIGIAAALLIAGGAYWWWRQPVEPIAIAEPVSTPAPAPSLAVPEAAPPELVDDSASYRSENFKAGEIVFLGEAEFLQTDEGIAPITLDGIRGEAFTEKNKQEVKLVITWNTNKLARGEVSYAKGIGQTPSVVETDDFAYDHSLILSGLDPATTYLYTIKATDRFGNVITSEPYAVFTGARSVSLFDLIAGAIGEVFGWAVK